jgi:hypothetical protein
MMLVGLGLLGCLLACGYYGAALALRDLVEGRVPKLGPVYRVYVVASNGYAVRRDARGDVARFPAVRVRISQRQARVVVRRSGSGSRAEILEVVR